MLFVYWLLKHNKLCLLFFCMTQMIVMIKLFYYYKTTTFNVQYNQNKQKEARYYELLKVLVYYGCVWFEREVEKREIDEREFEKRERDEKYRRLDLLFGIKERREK